MAELLGQARLLNHSCASVFLSVQWEFHCLTHRSKDYRTEWIQHARFSTVSGMDGPMDRQTHIHTHTLGKCSSHPQGWLSPEAKEKSASPPWPLLKAKDAAISDQQ